MLPYFPRPLATVAPRDLLLWDFLQLSPSDSVLEIGVGTGLSFDDYDATTEIVGIDISEPMIARARERLLTGRYPFVKELAVMDAQELAYADASFDCVVGQFVITLVEEPERVLSECARVLRPGGQIILVNHLYSERGLMAAVERLLAQKARKLGLRPEFPFQRLAAWAQAHGGAELIERRKVRPFGAYTLVRFRRAVSASGAKPQWYEIGKRPCHKTETGRW